MSQNIAGMKNCYGCGVCAAVCPRRIIDLKLDVNGFYTPFITDSQACIECGLCRKTCAYLADGFVGDRAGGERREYYAAWNRNRAVRLLSSSGGIATGIADSLLQKGYKVIGAKYDPDNGRVEHFAASDRNAYFASLGSKYQQSYTCKAFRSILSSPGKYAVFGTPCQTASLRRLLHNRKEGREVVLIDFFCHGVPSMLLWQAYRRMNEKKCGEFRHVRWRNKISDAVDAESFDDIPQEMSQEVSWHRSYRMKIRGSKRTLSAGQAGSRLFYGLFLGDYCLGAACYDRCPYKRSASEADIRIGDLWGAYSEQQMGVSALIGLTPRGCEVIASVENCELHPVDSETVLKGQMSRNARRPFIARVVLAGLRCGLPLRFLYWGLVRPHQLVKGVFKRLKFGS